MKSIYEPTKSKRSFATRVILEDLEAVRENLLELSDDIWSSIDQNDAEALEAGIEFKRAYNAKVAAFDLVASELSQLILQYTSVRLEATEQTGTLDDSSNERIIAELDREIPHALDEDFTLKRPFGFVLDGQSDPPPPDKPPVAVLPTTSATSKDAHAESTSFEPTPY